MSTIGESISEGIIDRMQDSVNEIENVTKEAQNLKKELKEIMDLKLSLGEIVSVSTTTTGKTTKTGTPLPGDSTWSAENKLKYFSTKTNEAKEAAYKEIEWAGDKYWDYIEAGDATKAKGANDWANQIRDAIGDPRQEVSMENIIATINANKGGMIVPARNFDDGGFAGEEKGVPSRLARIAKALFGIDDKHVLTKDLIGELHIPPNNIANNMIPNIKNMINNIMPNLTPVTAGADVTNIYNVDMRIGTVTGDKKGANFMYSEFIKSLKGKGKM